MKIVIGNKPIELLPKEIKVAKALYTKFLQEVKTNSVDNGVPSLYFTTIIIPIHHIKIVSIPFPSFAPFVVRKPFYFAFFCLR